MKPRFPLVPIALLLAYWLGRRNGYTEGHVAGLLESLDRDLAQLGVQR